MTCENRGRRCPPRRCRAPFLALAILAPATVAAETLEIDPAWGGRFVTGWPTELGVRLASDTGGEAAISVTGGAGSLDSRVEIEAGRLHFFTVPAFPGPDGEIRVLARLPGTEQAAARLDLIPQPRRFRVWVSPPVSRMPEYRPPAGLEMRASDLPRNPAGYGPVAELIVPAAALAALDPDQTAALEDYLSACRPLWVQGAAETVLERIRSAAGCSGRFVHAASDEGHIGTAPQPESLPADIALDRLLGLTETPISWRLAQLLMPYPLLLLGFLALRRPGPWLLALPVAATLVYAWAIPRVSPAAGAVTWAEMDAGDPVYRFASLLALQGGDPRSEPLRLSAGAGTAWSLERPPPTIGRDGDTGFLSFPPPARLLSRQRYRMEGSRASPLGLRIASAVDAVMLENTGAEPVPAGWLFTQGTSLPTPALAPGSKHRLDTGEPGASPPTGVPRPRGTDPTLVTPLAHPLGPGSDPRIRASGWLLVHAPGKAP